MNRTQRVIVVLLVLALLFSVVSIVISIAFINAVKSPSGSSYSQPGNGNIELVVTGNNQTGATNP